MATFDQLSAEQRAIVELVLQQGKTYAELSEMLGMPEPRVRELARDALVELAPVSVGAVEEDWRGQLADYVLDPGMLRSTRAMSQPLVLAKYSAGQPEPAPKSKSRRPGRRPRIAPIRSASARVVQLVPP